MMAPGNLMDDERRFLILFEAAEGWRGHEALVG